MTSVALELFLFFWVGKKKKSQAKKEKKNF
jgi:hypothetical protein